MITAEEHSRIMDMMRQAGEAHGRRLLSRIVKALFPLAGHSGECAKVTSATVLGKTDVDCTCGATNV